MKIQRLLQLLESVPKPELRKPFLETALAVEIAYSLALPSGRVESVVAHFDQFHAEQVKQIIGEVNELYPFNVNVTYNMVVDAFKNRYVICHEPCLLTADDIAAQLRRPAFQMSVDPVHAEVLQAGYSKLLRDDLCEFIRRFIPA